MQSAHDVLRQELRDALLYWRAQVELERMACSRGSRDIPQVKGVLLARRELGPVMHRLAAQSNHSGPLPELGTLEDWIQSARWQWANHSADSPRSEFARATELSEALRSASWIRRAFGESTRGLMDLAHDWVALFQRWDWLLVAWRLKGAPRAPEVQLEADPLEGLHSLVSVYLAQTDPLDLPHWLAARIQNRQALAMDLGIFCQGPLDAELLAAATVLSAADPIPLHWPLLDLPASPPLLEAWPEVQDLLSGRVPQPESWPALASRRACAAIHAPFISRSGSPISVQLCGASQLESAVDQAILAVHANRLAEAPRGRALVAVVAFDRLMARRLTVKLQQQGLKVEDPSGWTLDTTAASAPMDGLLDLVQPGSTPQQVFHWLSLPMVQAALESPSEAFADLYRSFRRLSPLSPGFQALPAPIRQILQPLQQLACSRVPQTFEVWVDRVERTIHDLGLGPGMVSDAAGALVLGSLRQLRAEHPSLTEGSVRVQWAQFRASLSRRLGEARLALREPGEADVRMVGLSEAALDPAISAVILLGATEGQMLASSPSPLLSRRQMDLACARQPESVERAVALAHLAHLLNRGIPLVGIGAPAQAGSEIRWASALVRLRAVLPSVVRTEPLVPTRQPERQQRHNTPTACIPPRVAASLPPRLSVTSLQALAVCPLQFFWRAQLDLSGWRALASVEGPAERGTWLHAVAEAVPQRLQQQDPPSDVEGWFAFLLQILRDHPHHQESDVAFQIELEQRLRSLALWLAKPDLPLPLEAERTLEGVLPLSGQRVKGRADWVLPCGVVDLKTTDPSELRKGIQASRSDLQLQVYAHLLSSAPEAFSASDLAFLSVRVDRVQSIEVEPSAALLEKLDQTLSEISQGRPMEALEAQGEGLACSSCPARGACRPEEWAT